MESLHTYVLRVCNDPFATKLCCLGRLRFQADGTDACNGCQRSAALFNPLGFIKISDAFLSHDMAYIIAIDHDRRDGHASFLPNFNRIQRFDKGRNTTFRERLKSLDYKLSAASIRAWVRFQIEPRRRRMTTPVGIMSHVWRTTEAGKTACRYGRGIGITVHLEGCADKAVDRVLSGKLAQHTVGAKTSVAAVKEDIGPGANVVIHAHFAAKRVDALNPAALDRWYKCRMRVEREVLAYLPAKSQGLPIRRQQKFDGSGIEADTVIERLDLVPFVDPTNDHHPGQNLKLSNVARVAGK